MSSLWNARVVEIGGGTVVLRLTAIHPDAGEPARSAAFAVRLLADGLERAAGAAERASALDARADAGTAGEVVAQVAVTDRRNLPFSERAAKERIHAVLRERGLDPADAAAWDAAFQAEWRALWQDPSRAPQATLTVEVREAGLLEGLAGGDNWESAAYG
ncbi:hypothetical protein SAMN04487983_105419 [Streptomyces sp. yr375]|uniref:hypothetical protein n=1 Tax=Streptomyces sp. yr375 TaxID=1761906 RepID=UPI0008D1FAD6|nr:hypothetical protein [Streptomyces sp. yr375]SES43583.1 hypothetical protein SAMN04487983_105419 [Streptomyces sp. yr375]